MDPGGCGGSHGGPLAGRATPFGPSRPAPSSPPPTGTPRTGGLFGGTQPWTADVLAALTRAGGWGNGNVLQADFAMPVLTADAGTPRMPVTPAENYCSGGPDCDAVPAEMPVPEGATIEGSTDLTCDVASQDCHLLVADTAARRLYELYQGTRAGDGLAAGAFVVWDLDTAYTDQLRGPQCTSADAAGFPIAALTATADEVASGRIDHALRFILPNDRMKAGVYVPPATHAGGPQSADRTTRAKWADLGIEAQSFAALTVDDFEVVDHGPEVPSTYECARN